MNVWAIASLTWCYWIYILIFRHKVNGELRIIFIVVVVVVIIITIIIIIIITMIIIALFWSETNVVTIIWDKVFKNGPSKISQRLSSTNFTWSILEYSVPYKAY